MTKEINLTEGGLWRFDMIGADRLGIQTMAKLAVMTETL